MRALNTIAVFMTIYGFVSGYLPPIYLSLIGSLLLVIPGIVYWGHVKREIKLTARLLTILVAPICFIVAGIIAEVVYINERPGKYGKVLLVDHDTVKLGDFEKPDKMVAEYVLKFPIDADISEVVFSLADEIRRCVDQLDVTTVSMEATEVITLTRKDKNEDGILVTPVDRFSKVTEKVSVIVRQKECAETYDVFVTYTHAERTFWWRTKKWICDRYCR